MKNKLECSSSLAMSIIFELDKHLPNQDESATRLCRQVAAWVPDMVCNFYFVKSHKIANNSATTEAREK
jgi:hypothetical protein